MLLRCGFEVDSVLRGAGCVFVEMLQGAPAFPGEAAELQQLQTIFQVRRRRRDVG